MEEINKFIQFINNLVDDEFCNYIDNLDPRYYFLHGGCLEFAKVLKHFIPASTYMINSSLGHVAIKIEDTVYDATGIINNNEFVHLKDEELYLIEDIYGIKEIKFGDMVVHKAIINELYSCSGDYVSKLVASINKKIYNNQYILKKQFKYKKSIAKRI